MSEQEMYEEIEIDDQALMDYIREVTSNNEAIKNLTDDEIQYLLDLWYDYLVEIDSNEEDNDEEDMEIDSDDLYEYVQEALENEEVDFEISQDDLLELLDAEQSYVEELFEEEEEK